MAVIKKAEKSENYLLSKLGKETFLESHGNSASHTDISLYVAQNYSSNAFKNELTDSNNLYHIIYHEEIPAGFSKINLNSSHPDIPFNNVTKFDRLYVLKEYYNMKLGLQLFEYNLSISKNNGQDGMWLFVWKENERAVNFYRKAGFEIIGSYDFKISEDHSNPNYQMLLKY
ncbi:hypothetical protein BH10BAC5_BH10BAC5_02160 [soil metagenome]